MSWTSYYTLHLLKVTIHVITKKIYTQQNPRRTRLTRRPRLIPDNSERHYIFLQKLVKDKLSPNWKNKNCFEISVKNLSLIQPVMVQNMIGEPNCIGLMDIGHYGVILHILVCIKWKSQFDSILSMPVFSLKQLEVALG